MITLLLLLVLLPLVAFVINFSLPERNENILSLSAIWSIILHFNLCLILVIWWFIKGHPLLSLKEWVLYRTDGYEFFIDFYFDKITAVYLLAGSFLSTLVAIYCRAYLHREKGYKRFFNTILFFYSGYSITVLSGNFETLFIGWEILGISSFLLISFYRDRYLPVKNAVKIFSIYRIGDVGLLLAMWMSHHLWHQNITFQEFNQTELVHEHLQSHTLVGVFISLMILVAAAAKSAQLPFSSWLPRAMEGPTPSSAIFYGSLSVHIGVFLLLRTYTFWEYQLSVRIIIALLGLATTIVTTGIARVQSSVKSQIAYASAAQIGLIFIEVALGFHDLALIHFAGNAFLRTYQLLVSPSVVSYLIREQQYEDRHSKKSIEFKYPKRIQYALYVLSLKEWELDTIKYRYLWNPLKQAGKKIDFLTIRSLFYFFVPVSAIGIYFVYHRERISGSLSGYLSVLFSFIGLLMILKAFTERRKVRLSWLLIIMNHFFIALAALLNESFDFTDVYVYISGIVIAGIIGFICLGRLRRMNQEVHLERFHGYSYEYPRLSFVFLLSCLGLAGFPITPTFIGEDLIFSHIHQGQIVLAVFVSLSVILNGLAVIRIYARLFLGPHERGYHEVAYRSS